MISLSGATGSVVTAGMDQVLLTQRNEFMRSDSLLAIIMLSDETDTSLKEYGQYPLFAQETQSNNQPFHLPHGRQECTDPMKGPADPCCLSCGEKAPPSCPADSTCVGPAGTYNSMNENLGLRAFGLSGWLQSHKARYGIEWFYQPSRYVQALTSATVQDSAGNMVTNPIFKQNPNEPNASVRDPGLVFYAAITGVPWQLIARDATDLKSGTDPLDMTQVGGFKTYEELNLKDSHGNTFWDDIVGDPENYVYPLSPYMQESTAPRSGTGTPSPARRSRPRPRRTGRTRSTATSGSPPWPGPRATSSTPASSTSSIRRPGCPRRRTARRRCPATARSAPPPTTRSAIPTRTTT